MKRLLFLIITIAFCGTSYGLWEINYDNVSNPETLTYLLQERFGLIGNTYEFANGLTIDNATNNAFEWNENDEGIIWTFGSDSLTLSSDTDVATFDFGTVDPTCDQITLENGLVIENSTDNQFKWTEKSETLIWTFDTNDISLSSGSGVTDVNFANLYISFNEISAPTGDPAANCGWLYVKDSGGGTTTLYFEDSVGTVTSCIGSGSPGGSDTYIQYNNNSAFGGIANFIYDDTNIELEDDFSIAFGTDADWTINFDASAASQLLIATDANGASAATDPMIQILVDADTASGANMDADQDVFGIAKGTQASNTDLFVVDEDGDIEAAGSLTLGGTFYQAGIAAAASGNTALTINAGLTGNGTITLGDSSTGNIILTRATTCSSTLGVTGATTLSGAATLGDAAADDITITGDVVADIRLDDDTTDSPGLQFIDAGEYDWKILKANGSTGNLTVTSDQGGSDFQIVTGNLKVGAGSESVTLNGEDAYVTGTFEVDSTSQFDGAVTVNDAVTLNDQLAIAFNANDEEIDVTGTATNMTAAAMMTLTMAAQDSVKHILRLIQTPDADADNEFLLLEDSAGDDKFEIEDGGNTIWTLDDGKFLTVDADTTIRTDTSGYIYLKGRTSTTGGKGMFIDMETDAATAATTYGLWVDIDDDDTGGDSTVIALGVGNTNGGESIAKGFSAVDGLLDDIIDMKTAAAGQAVVLDAATNVSTNTDGVFDIAYQTATNTASLFNIDAGVGNIGSGETTHVFYIDMDDDDTADTSTYNGITINGSDLNGGALVQAIYVQSADCALQADKGYVRIGTGDSPGVTPGDDDLFVEGTVEINSMLYADGHITGLNGETITNDTNNEWEFGANGAEDFSFNLGTSNTVTLTTDSDTDTWAWGSIDALTGIGSLAFDAAASTITLPASGNDQDLTMQVTGAFDSSLIFQNTGGTGADAIAIYTDGTGGSISIDTDSGAISIVADGASAGDITIDSEDDMGITVGGNLTVTVTGTTSFADNAITNVGDISVDDIIDDANGIIVYPFKVLTVTVDVNDDDPTDDFKFDNDAADQTEQGVKIANIPAWCEVSSVLVRCIETVTDSNTLSIEIGTSSGGNEIHTTSDCDTANDLITTAVGAAPEVAVTGSAIPVYINGTPGCNWDELRAGRWAIMITYIDYAAAYAQKNP